MSRLVVLLAVSFSVITSGVSEDSDKHICRFPYTCIFKDFNSTEEFRDFLERKSNIYYDGFNHIRIDYNSIKIIQFENSTMTRLPLSIFQKFTSVNDFTAPDIGIESIEKIEISGTNDNLQILNLTRNKIKKLENSQFINLSGVRVIDLSHNLIEEILPEVFNETYPYLKEIYLGFNRITQLNEGLIQLLPYIGYGENVRYLLDLEGNQIGKLTETECKQQVMRFAKINLKSNKLLTFDIKCVTVSSYIEELDLSNNSLSPMSVSTFAEMKKLKKLTLSNVGLKDIPFGLFAHQKRLEVLDLSHNHLKKIDYHKFSSLDRLKTLNVSGNDLSEINNFENIKRVVPSLSQIGLEENDWDCTYLSKMKISFNLNRISLLEAVNPVKNESNIFGIKCSSNERTTSIASSNAADIGRREEIGKSDNNQLNDIKLKDQITKLELNNKVLEEKIAKQSADISNLNLHRTDDKRTTWSEIILILLLVIIATILSLIAIQNRNFMNKQKLKPADDSTLVNCKNLSTVDFLSA